MMLADPRLVIIQPVEMLQEFEVALDRQGRVLVVIMKRRQEDAASQIEIAHDVASGAGRSPVVIVGDCPWSRQAISGGARIARRTPHRRNTVKVAPWMATARAVAAANAATIPTRSIVAVSAAKKAMKPKRPTSRPPSTPVAAAAPRARWAN